MINPLTNTVSVISYSIYIIHVLLFVKSYIFMSL